MKIIVVADTHKDLEKYSNVVANNDADCYIHLGDGALEFADVAKLNPKKEFVLVRGNCDYCEASLRHVLSVGKFKIYCVHGHEQNVSQGIDTLIAEAKERGCNIVLYGHTHLYKTDYIDGIYVMNPGSLGAPRGKNNPSFGTLEITDDGKVRMDIVAY